MVDRRSPVKGQSQSKELVLVGDEMVPDEENYFGPGDLAMMSMEIDRQVSTAKRYPRDEALAEAKAKKMVTETEDIALSCIYTLPRAKKLIPGASVRLAEIVAYCWGNARYGSKVIEEEDEFIVAQGVYFDIERNIANTKTVRRRITDSDGRRYNTDMVQTTGSAAMAIALRNSILQGGIPSPIWMPVYDSAAALIGGATKPLSVRRQMALERFAKLGVPEEKVLLRIGVKTAGNIEQEHIVILRGLAQAIKDEVVTIDQAFPEARRARTEAKRTDVGSKLRGDGKEEPPPAGEEPDGPGKATSENQGDAEPAGAEAQPEPTGPAQGTEAAEATSKADAPQEDAQDAKDAQDSPPLPEEDRDVIADVTAAVSGGGKPSAIAADFRDAIDAMSPEGKAVVESILAKAGKSEGKKSSAVRLL